MCACACASYSNGCIHKKFWNGYRFVSLFYADGDDDEGDYYSKSIFVISITSKFTNIFWT